jgi:hypothetical protein
MKKPKRFCIRHLPFANSLQRIGKHTAFAKGECIEFMGNFNAALTLCLFECEGICHSL